MSPEIWDFLKSFVFPVILGVVTLAIAFQNTKKANADTLQRAIDNGQKNAEFSQEQFKRAQERADDAHKKFEEANGRIDQLLHRNGELKDELDKVKNNLDERDNELAEAQTEINTLLSNLEKRVVENAELQKQVDVLKAKVEKLERIEAELTEARSQVAQLNRQIATMNAERHGLIEAHNDDLRRFQERELDLKNEIAALRTKTEELIQRVKTLESENIELRAEVATWSPAALPKDVNSPPTEADKPIDQSEGVKTS